MATSAPAAEEPEVAEEPKKKSPIVLIIAGVVGLIVLIIAVVLGTLFFTGYFNPKPEVEAEHAEAAADGGHGDKKGDAKEGGPPKLNKKSPDSPRFEYTYFQLEREFLVNLTGSKKVMSVQIALMTRYDERVIENVKKHEFALRSAIMDAMRMTTEADLAKPDFRKDLAKKVADVMNTLLEKYEDFGGVEEINFTNFIVQ
jgi:flagellar FliL protein